MDEKFLQEGNLFRGVTFSRIRESRWKRNGFCSMIAETQQLDDGLRVIIDFSHPGQAVIAHDRPSFLSSMNPSNNSRKRWFVWRQPTSQARWDIRLCYYKHFITSHQKMVFKKNGQQSIRACMGGRIINGNFLSDPCISSSVDFLHPFLIFPLHEYLSGFKA